MMHAILLDSLAYGVLAALGVGIVYAIYDSMIVRFAFIAAVIMASIFWAASRVMS